MHKHKCRFCAFVWQHADVNDVSHNSAPGSHECPSCHRCNWGLGIYTGAEEPRVTNGRVGIQNHPVTFHEDQRHTFGD